MTDTELGRCPRCGMAHIPIRVCDSCIATGLQINIPNRTIKTATASDEIIVGRWETDGIVDTPSAHAVLWLAQALMVLCGVWIFFSAVMWWIR